MTTERGARLKCLNAFHLKLLAMGLMLCDHMWATVIPGSQWMNAVGRLAFPIFAFQIVEGYFHTRSFKGYLKRMLLFALLSEIPFNLMYGGSMVYPFHQNVMFTFCIALALMRLIDLAGTKGRAAYWVAAAGCCLLGYVLGFVTMVDFFGYGVLTVLLFYLCRGRRFGWLGQLAGMAVIHGCMVGGLMLSVPVAGHVLEFDQQALAVLALIPIWLYNGRQGYHSKPFQYACYAFYPVHMLILSLVVRLFY